MSAEAKEEAAEAAPAGAAGGGDKGGKLVMILTLVNVVATLGMVAILFISFQRDKKTPAVEDIAVHSPDGHGEKKEGEAGGGHGEAKGGHGGGHGDAKTAHPKTTDFGKMVTLEQFTVNLSTPGSVNPKFVRVNISLEVPNEDAESEVNAKMPQIRNAVIDLFNSKRPGDLANAEGRDYLKDEIKNTLNGFLVNGKVRGVFFTNFALTS